MIFSIKSIVAQVDKPKKPVPPGTEEWADLPAEEGWDVERPPESPTTAPHKYDRSVLEKSIREVGLPLPSKMSPDIMAPPETPESLQRSQDLATEQLAEGMVEVAPGVYINDNVVQTLTGFATLGFDISSKQKIMDLAELMPDLSFGNEVLFYQPDEWNALLGYIKEYTAANAPSPGDWSAHALMYVLDDVGLYANVESPSNARPNDHFNESMAVLQKLVESNSPIAPLAKGVLESDDAARAELMGQTTKSLREDQFADLPETPGYKTVSGPTIDEYGNEVFTEFRDPETGRIVKQQEFGPYLVGKDDKEMPWEVLKRERKEETGGKPQPTTKDDTSQDKPNEPVVEVLPAEPMPASKAQSRGSAAVGLNRQEFVDNYEAMAAGIPGIQMSDYGEVISGIKILSSDKSSQLGLSELVKGGDFVKAYAIKTGSTSTGGDTGAEGMAIGRTLDGMLAVRVFPTGEAEAWDIESCQVRLGMQQKKRKTY